MNKTTFKHGSATIQAYIPRDPVSGLTRSPWHGLAVTIRPASEIEIPEHLRHYKYFAVHDGEIVSCTMTNEGLVDMLRLTYTEKESITVYRRRVE